MAADGEAIVTRSDLENLIRRRWALGRALRESRSPEEAWALEDFLDPMLKLHNLWCWRYRSRLPDGADPELLRVCVRALRTPECLLNEGPWSNPEGQRYREASRELDPIFAVIESRPRSEPDASLARDLVPAAKPRVIKPREPSLPLTFGGVAEYASNAALRLDEAVHRFLEREWRTN